MDFDNGFFFVFVVDGVVPADSDCLHFVLLNYRIEMMRMDEWMDV